MMQAELTGIERELVLKYLMDGNVPVTLTPIVTGKESNSNYSPQSVVFPVAIRSSKMKVLEEGIIVLQNPQQIVADFVGKKVQVEFYFNSLGLCFITEMRKIASGLAMVVPDTINRISDIPEKSDYNFSAVLFYSCGKNRSVHIDCIPANGYGLFSKPVWSDIEPEYASVAKQYLKQFVFAERKAKKTGNGLFLIPVCRYLAENIVPVRAVQHRADPLKILYINHECIVLGQESESVVLEKGMEYALKMVFPLESGSVKKRDVFVTCSVDYIYSSDREKMCFLCLFTSMKEEDRRFVYELTTKNLFV
jgi:hypothetical protein